MSAEFTDDQVHRILLEHKFFFTIKEVCARWSITPYRFKKWRKERFPPHPFWTVEDCIIAAIHPGGSHLPADLISWLDYRNHNLYSADEVREMFERLERRGEVKRDGDRWSYVQVDPPYIFGPRPSR